MISEYPWRSLSVFERPIVYTESTTSLAKNTDYKVGDYGNGGFICFNSSPRKMQPKINSFYERMINVCAFDDTTNFLFSPEHKIRIYSYENQTRNVLFWCSSKVTYWSESIDTRRKVLTFGNKMTPFGHNVEVRIRPHPIIATLTSTYLPSTFETSKIAMKAIDPF